MSHDLAETKGREGLRDKPPADYRKLHAGDVTWAFDADVKAGDQEISEEFESVLEEGATGGTGQISGAQPSETAENVSNKMATIDEEMDIVAARMKRLDEEERLLVKSNELHAMKIQLREKEQKVKKLRGTKTISDVAVDSLSKLSFNKSRVKTKSNTRERAKSPKTTSEHPFSSSQSVKTTVVPKVHEDIDINSLLNDKKLRRSVQKELQSLGLKITSLSSDSSDSSSDSSLSSDSDSDTDTSYSSSRKSKKKKKSKKQHLKKKSGIKAKSSNKVKAPQKWPHAHLQYEFVNKEMKFEDLDYRLFIAGELEVISEASISSSEKQGRINLLKKIIYYTGTYEIKGLKAFYAAWLREIELGKKTWLDDPTQIETAILTKYLKSNKPTSFQSKKSTSKSTDDADKANDKVWFCNLFQRNKCPHKSSHMIVHKNQAKLSQHICATCWQKDKVKLPHPESSSSCPHASA